MQQYCEGLLTATGLNTVQHIEVVRQYPNLDKLAYLLYAMYENNLCTQENLDKLLLQEPLLTEKLIDIGYMLSRSPARLLNQENLADIFSKTASTLDLLLSKCQEGYVLSKDDFEAAQRFVKESECLALTREKLTQSGLWNELYAQYPNQQQLWQIVDNLSKNSISLHQLAKILYMSEPLRDNYMNLLDLLAQAKIVNQENVDKICSLRDPWKLTGALSCLQQSNQLNQEFFDKCFVLVEKVAYDGDALTAWVNMLHSSKLLTMDNLELLDSNGLPDLHFDYSSLKDLGMLDQIFLETILNHPQTSAFCDVLIKLRKADLLDESSQKIVENCADLSGLSESVAPLIDANLFTQKNLAIIADHDNPGALGQALRFLNISERLTPENLKIILEHNDPGALGQALRFLNSPERFTPENLKIILEHNDPGALGQALKSLKDSNFFFTQENFLAVLSHDQPHECTRALDVLKKSHKFVGEYYSAVLQHPKPYPLACAFDILLQRDFYVGDILAVSKLANPSPFLAACERLIQQNQDILGRENVDTLFAAARNEDPSALTREVNRIIQAYRRDQNQEEFNPEQSTHTGSVHRSLSESAIKLNARYGEDLDEKATIKAMRVKVEASHSGIALRCFDRLTSDEYRFADPVSNVSVHRLLALMDKALSDELNLRDHPEMALDELTLKADPDDAFKLFLQALLEIQRGGNLDRDGKDNKAPQDSPICPGGTFNKILEKLHGIHIDVNMRYITKLGAGHRLQHLAREHALKYLEHLATSNMSEAREVISAIHEDTTVEPVWGCIRDGVSQELWEEFREAFSGKADFDSFLEATGVYSPAPTLEEMEARLSAQTPLLPKLSLFQPSPNGGEAHQPKPKQ